MCDGYLALRISNPPDWPEPSILLASAIIPQYPDTLFIPIYKTSEFSWRRETPFPYWGTFSHVQSLAGSLPTDNNERTRRRVRVKLFYFPRRPFSLRSLHSLFSANSSHRAGNLPALTAKKALATTRHSFNLRITKRYTRQIPGLVLWRFYLHFSQRITVFHFAMCTFSARRDGSI